MLEIRAEQFNGASEFRALAGLHYKEIAKYSEEFPLDINWNLYKACIEMQRLIYVTAREDEELIGYFVGFLVGDHHSKNVLMCSTDSFFIRKDKRKGGIGLKLFKYVEELLTNAGVRKWSMSSNIDKNTNSLFEKMGASPHEIVYSKILGAK